MRNLKKIYSIHKRNQGIPKIQVNYIIDKKKLIK